MRPQGPPGSSMRGPQAKASQPLPDRKELWRAVATAAISAAWRKTELPRGHAWHHPASGATAQRRRAWKSPEENEHGEGTSGQPGRP